MQEEPEEHQRRRRKGGGQHVIAAGASGITCGGLRADAGTIVSLTFSSR